MASELTSKVRFVRCPGCRGILQEVAPLYQCSGCGKVLQAKNRKNDSTVTELHVHGTDVAQKNELEHVSDKHIAQCLKREQTCPSTGELLLDKNFGTDRSEILDSCKEKSGKTKFSSELLTKLTGHINDEKTGYYQGECFSGQNNEGDQNECGDYNAKQPEGVSFSNEVASTEINHHESEELPSPVAEDYSIEDLNQYSGRTLNQYEYCNGEQLGGANFSDGVASSRELNHHESVESSPLAEVYSEVDDSQNILEQKNGRNQTEFGDHERDGSGSTKFSDEFSSSTELTCQEVEDSSPLVATSVQLDENFKSRFIIGKLTEENLQDSTINAQRLSSEIISMNNQMSPLSEQLERSQERALGGFDRVSTKDTLEDFALSKLSPEFSLQFKDLPKYPTSGSYSAYNGSVSSYDGTVDQVPYQPQHLPEENFKKTECASADSMPVKDEVELQYQARNCSSISQQEHDAMEGMKCWEDELFESTRSGHPIRSWMKFETDEPFYSRSRLIVSEDESPSNYGRDVFQSSSSFDLPSKPQCPEEEKMKLLNMVYELQDELKRTHILQSRAKEIFPRVTGMEKQIPSYYGHVAPAVGIYHDIKNSRQTSSHNQGKNWTSQRQTSQIPFSAEPTIGRHQVDCSCFHGYRQECNCSAPLPPQIFSNNSQYTVLPRQRYYNTYASTSSSPQHYRRSEFSSRSHDVNSDEHWHADHHEGKIFSRERHQPMKKHVLPVAGGAPFLVCYKCSELLQLPADFLVYGRRCHRLRCSACSVILKFGLQNGSHILPYTEIYPDSIAPSPTNNGRKLALVSCAGYSPNVESVSCSDGCGPSLQQSCSTEEQLFSTVLPFGGLNRESNGSEMSSGSSFEPVEERKKQPIFIEHQNKYDSTAKLYASAGSPLRRSIAKKLSSEFEGLPPKSGLPLHKLLGYASPSQVLDSW